uniref:GATA transcription factor 11 n=1 Tax=Noccaea caerulescens TaxID=107243 RepID=A0A1J3E491_NOCCA
MNWLPEEEFKGLSDDFFDHIDFPLEDIDTTNGEGDWYARFQDLEPPPMDMFPSFPSEFTSCSISKGGRVGIQKTVPGLKQSTSSGSLSGVNSTFHHQSSSPPPDIKVSKLFQSSSPVSVLESSDGSYSPQNSTSQRLAFPVKGMRSKRKRPTALRFRYLFPSEPTKPEKFTPGESESMSYCSSEQPAKKKRKIQPPTNTASNSLEASNSDGIVRKCTHCETTKTPQWREGPNGPKTLCNACGVRFRSGRLVPEYRPASSPTFIPSVHSNSHRKIVEMRRKDDNQFDTGMIHAVISGA